MTDFNGQVIPTVYDKAQQQSTLANDGGSPFVFSLRNNVIYRGRATVTERPLRLHLRGTQGHQLPGGSGSGELLCGELATECGGYDNDALVGSTATDIASDEQWPADRTVHERRQLRARGHDRSRPRCSSAKLFDENGINTVGSSIGHDLLAVLDENTEQAMVLNDLYEADLDTYKSGEVRYRFSDLAEGSHTLRLKAWDVFNNSSESTTDFVVSSSAELALDHVLNYPNPFTTSYRVLLRAQPAVHHLERAGASVHRQRALGEDHRPATGLRRVTEATAWRGTARMTSGDKLGRGVYVYRLNVVTPGRGASREVREAGDPALGTQ